MLVGQKTKKALGRSLLDICICVHNPRVDVLSEVITSISKQTYSMTKSTVILVDNASMPRIEESILSPIRERGIRVKFLREEELGLQAARLRACQEIEAPMTLWVDDDNVLDPSYIERGMSFAKAHPKVGVFGGRLLLPESWPVRATMRPFLPFLAIRDLGENEIIEPATTWTPAQPPGAGAFVRQTVVAKYVEKSKAPSSRRLGRRGLNKLGSGEDSLMMRSAKDVGLKCAYVPQLVLYHHIDIRRRFRTIYLLKLMYGMGMGNTIVERILDEEKTIPNYYGTRRQFITTLKHEFLAARKSSFLFALGMMALHFGARNGYALKSGNVS